MRVAPGVAAYRVALEVRERLDVDPVEGLLEPALGSSEGQVPAIPGRRPITVCRRRDLRVWSPRFALVGVADADGAPRAGGSWACDSASGRGRGDVARTLKQG